jgi:hypothetical protein
MNYFVMSSEVEKSNSSSGSSSGLLITSTSMSRIVRVRYHDIPAIRDVGLDLFGRFNVAAL